VFIMATAAHSAIGYLRVSTAGQALEGSGLDVQRASIEATAARLELPIVAWCSDEGVSGTTDALDRTGFNCVVDHLISRDADTVLVHHADRLARDMMVQEAALAILWQHGATVFFGGELVRADDPNDSTRRLLRQIMGVIADYSRRDVIAKMHGGRKAIRRTDPGRYIGGRTVPAGCEVVDGRIIATPALVEELAVIRSGIQDGLTMNAVGKQLGLTGVQVKRRLATAHRLGLHD
jgi:DNA invertase Pin-like site-specific DNA recombinase